MQKSTWLKIAAIIGASILFYELIEKLSGFLLSIAVFLFLCLLAFLLYCAYRVYVALHHHYLELKRHRHEVQMQEEEVLAQVAKRKAFERQAHIDQHIQLTRVYPNNKGYVPVLIDADMEAAPHEMSYLALPSQNRSRQQHLPPPRYEEHYYEEERMNEVLIEEGQIPLQVLYEEISHLLRKGEFPLGVGVNGLEVCTFEQLMTMWICGGSDTGKSNTVAGFVDHAIKNGRNIKLVVIDPHANKPDSLYKRIQCYSAFFKFRVAVTPQEIEAALRWFKQEFNRRKQDGINGEEDILLIVDEVQSLADTTLIDEGDDAETLKYICKTIKGLAKVCGNESRGFGMFGWFISQNATGVAWLRKVVNTVVSHKMNMMSERRVACNENEKIARSMNNWPKRGRVVIYGNGLELKVLQMPLFPVRKVQNQIRSRYIPTDAYECEEVEEREELQPRVDVRQQKAVREDARKQSELSQVETGIEIYLQIENEKGKPPTLDEFAAYMNLNRNGSGRTLFNQVKVAISRREKEHA